MAIEEREPILLAAIGQRGVGKTFTTLQEINDYIRGDASVGMAPRKVIILDVNDEFTNFPAIPLREIPKFASQKKVAAYRIRIYKDQKDIKMMGWSTSRKMDIKEIGQACHYMLENFRGGLALIEDPTKFISNSLPMDLVGSICTMRHLDCDVYMHFQYLGKIAHPTIWASLNYIRYHNVDDSVEKHRNRFGSDVTYLYLAEKLIKLKRRNGDKRFFVYVDKEYSKVSGNFSAEDFTQAIEEYLEEDVNYRRIILPLVNKKKARTGEKVYADQAGAVDSLIKEYHAKYYGN